MTPLISLDDDAALDPARVGVKAAHLAKARRHGLRVLPGVVVPVEAGRAAIEHGIEVLRAEGPGKARLAVDRAALSEELASVLPAAGASVGENLILRSSTTLDDDARFAGAFASIADVRPGEVTSAVRGCWSSLFSASALGRIDGAGVRLDEIGVSVLLQRMLDPQLGGTAELLADGSVAVAAVAGRPGPLLAGAVNGRRGTVVAGDEVPEDLSELGLSPALASALFATVHGAPLVGGRRIEWAVEAGRLWVLQLNPTAAATVMGSNGIDGAERATPTFHGTPASPGRATGRVLRLHSIDEHADDVDGRILVVDEALAVYAPLLYRAAGLVAIEGSLAAHLCTVARSLHVPAVVGLQSFERDVSTLLWNTNLCVVVNGDLGTVGIAEPRVGTA